MCAFSPSVGEAFSSSLSPGNRISLSAVSDFLDTVFILAPRLIVYSDTWNSMGFEKKKK